MAATTGITSTLWGELLPAKIRQEAGSKRARKGGTAQGHMPPRASFTRASVVCASAQSSRDSLSSPGPARGSLRGLAGHRGQEIKSTGQENGNDHKTDVKAQAGCCTETDKVS